MKQDEREPQPQSRASNQRISRIYRTREILYGAVAATQGGLAIYSVAEGKILQGTLFVAGTGLAGYISGRYAEKNTKI